MTVVTSSPDETKALGEKLAKNLKCGDILALEGELGSGKTQFVKGLAKGLGVSQDSYVRSPSFILLNEYAGRLPLYHFDFYRLTTPFDLDTIGMEEYFDGDGITVIEWADKFPAAIPKRAVHIKFEVLDENHRIIKFDSRYFHFIKSIK